MRLWGPESVGRSKKKGLTGDDYFPGPEYPIHLGSNLAKHHLYVLNDDLRDTQFLITIFIDADHVFFARYLNAMHTHASPHAFDIGGGACYRSHRVAPLTLLY
jgi:hypothetical protein